MRYRLDLHGELIAHVEAYSPEDARRKAVGMNAGDDAALALIERATVVAEIE